MPKGSSQVLNIDRVLATIAFILLAVALGIIAITPRASGYEITIYDAYPFYLWLFLAAAIACGIGILVRGAFAEGKPKWEVAGLSIVIFANSVFLLLFEFRGYALYGRGDTLTHLGHIIDIVNTGHIGAGNFYPIEHILGVGLIEVVGISLENIPSLFFVLFSGIYLINMCLLARSLSNRAGQVLLMAALASVLMYSYYHVTIHPCFLALFMLPSLFYLFHKRGQALSNQLQITVLLLVVAFLIVFFHPITALFTVIIFLAFGLAHAFYQRFLSSKPSDVNQYRTVGANPFRISLIMFIIFFIWYFSFSAIQRNFRAAYEWLAYEIGTPLAAAEIGRVAELGLTPFQAVKLFMDMYGALCLLMLISMIALVYVARKIISRRHEVGFMEFAYAIGFIIASFVGALELFGAWGENMSLFRVARFPMLMGTILSGLVFYKFIEGNSMTNIINRRSFRRLGLMIVMSVTIIAMATLSMGTVYNSPKTYRTNAQVTEMEIVGTEWFAKTKNPNILTVLAYDPMQLYRFEDYNFGRDSSPFTRARISSTLPSHFGYNEYRHIAEGFDFQERYIVIFERDKVYALYYPENVRPNVPQWTEEDFAKLSADSTVSQIYTNGELEVWKIEGR